MGSRKLKGAIYVYHILCPFLYGNNLVLADRGFASTQICSHCGNRKEKSAKLTLSERVYYCDNDSCPGNAGMDRDANAAANLLQYGLEILGKL